MEGNKLEKVMNDYPDLTTHGLGVDTWSSSSFDDERNALGQCTSAFKACCDWLTQTKSVSTPNRKIGTSYRLKHVVERWYYDKVGQHLYIPEGALIAAALSMGFSYSKISGRVNVYLGISSKSVK